MFKRLKSINKEEILLAIILAATQKYEKTAEELKKKNYIHSVTGLFNRKYLIERGNQEILKGVKTGIFYTVDIRDLRKYNEIFGYHITDAILQNVAEFITEICSFSCKSEASIGTLDAGIFWIFEPFIDDYSFEDLKKKAEKIAESIIQALSSGPISLIDNKEKISVILSVNLGAAFYPYHGKTVEELLMAAEIATEKSKQKGGNIFLIFDPKMKEDIEENLKIEQLIKESIKNGTLEREVYPVFQLKVNPKTRSITGVELLMRWTRWRNIGKVIPILERTGAINQFFDVLIEKAIPVFERAVKIIPNISFSINISPVQFRFLNELSKTLERFKGANIPNEIVELEIVESAFAEKGASYVEEFLKETISKGFKLVIDDFGRGFSSFDRLKVLPIHGVKLDRSLIEDLENIPSEELKGNNSYRFVKSLISFLRSMEYKITVEGVETENIVRFLSDLGVDEVQGYYFAKPVSEDIFLRCLRDWERTKKCEG